MKKVIILKNDPLRIFSIDIEENVLRTVHQKTQSGVLLKVPFMLRLLGITAGGNTLGAIHQKDDYKQRPQFPASFSSRYEVTFSKKLEAERLLTDELEDKLVLLYDSVKNSRRHPVLLKYVLYYYSIKTGTPLYKLPITQIVYSNDSRGEKKLSVNAVIKTTYRLLPLFENI